MKIWFGKDCGGKECLNGGKLDANTCKCACKGFWEGDSCDKRKDLPYKK